MTTTAPRAGTLILRHIDILAESARLLQTEIEPEVIQALENQIETWAEERKWHLSRTKGAIWFGPTQWLLNDGPDESKAWFGIGVEDENAKDTLAVVDWCGHGLTRMGFWLSIDFKRICKTSLQWSRFTSGLTEIDGFTHQKGYWFMPITLSPESLAAAYERGDYNEALSPLRQALECIKRAQETVDGILETAEKEFGSSFKKAA